VTDVSARDIPAWQWAWRIPWALGLMAFGVIAMIVLALVEAVRAAWRWCYA
jgi:hypothetical protein